MSSCCSSGDEGLDEEEESEENEGGIKSPLVRKNNIGLTKGSNALAGSLNSWSRLRPSLSSMPPSHPRCAPELAESETKGAKLKIPSLTASAEILG